MEENAGRDIDAAPQDGTEGTPQAEPQSLAEQDQTPIGEDSPEAPPTQESPAAEEVPAEEPAEAAPPVEPPAEEEPPADEPSADPVADEAADAEGVPAEEPIARLDSAEPQGADDTPAAPVAKPRIPWWPYLVYLVAWIGVVGAAFYVISYQPDAPPAFSQDDYAYILLAGLVLTVLGPLLSFLVWFIKWLRSPKGERGGLLTAALVKGALVTFLGVLLWWGAMILLDALRLGMLESIV